MHRCRRHRYGPPTIANGTDWTMREPIRIETIVDYRVPASIDVLFLKDDVQIAAHFRSRGHG